MPNEKPENKENNRDSKYHISGIAATFFTLTVLTSGIWGGLCLGSYLATPYKVDEIDLNGDGRKDLIITSRNAISSREIFLRQEDGSLITQEEAYQRQFQELGRVHEQKLGELYKSRRDYMNKASELEKEAGK